MKIVSINIHSMIDYIMGSLLLLMPTLLGFGDAGTAAWIPRFMGLFVLGYSLITNYEFSLAKMLPLPTHFTLDYLTALFLVISPFLFGFANIVWFPHVIVGMAIFLSSRLTDQPDEMTVRQM